MRARLVPGGGPAGQLPRIFNGCTHAAHEGQPQALLLVFAVSTVAFALRPPAHARVHAKDEEQGLWLPLVRRAAPTHL